MTHGWPGSIIEQMKILDPLTNPTEHGASATDAFDIVIPSMPGYGYSGQADHDGLGSRSHRARLGRVDEAPRLQSLRRARRRLGRGHHRSDGRPGAFRIDRHPHEHARNFPGEIDAAAFSGAPAPSGLSADEKLAYERLQFVYQKGIAYGFRMGLRPQTLYGIADSPIGLAAYFLDHDARSYELIARVFQGQAEGLTRDDILDNITITWFTNTALSGARLYWEYFGKGYFNAKGVSIPVAVSVFPDELYPAPRSWTERAYPKLIHYNKLPKGGHFAAWEQPQSFSAEVRAGFRSLR